MQTTLDTYRVISSRLPARLEAITKRPDIARDIADFESRIGRIQSASALVDDPKLLRFVTRAFGLEDVAFGKALLRRVIEEGTRSPDSLANRLVDQRFKDLAAAFDFSRPGQMQRPAVRQAIVDRFVRLQLEQDVGRTSEGARLALYFERKAPEVRSAYGLLADRALAEVTVTLLGLPQAFRSLDIDKQADIISKRLDIPSLRDPAQRDKLLKRFAALHDVARGPQAASIPAPFRSDGRLDDKLLQSLQQLQRR
jgi:hypothetical protein